MTLSFLALDFFSPKPNFNEELSLAIGAAAGGFIAGFWQSRLLPSQRTIRLCFVAASTVGWCLAASLPALVVRGHPAGALEAFRNIGTILGGGVVLGMVTGCTLIFVPIDDIVAAAASRPQPGTAD